MKSIMLNDEELSVTGYLSLNSWLISTGGLIPVIISYPAQSRPKAGELKSPSKITGDLVRNAS